MTYAAALKVPMLDVEQERKLIHSWQTHQDESSLEVLIEAHARQVHAYVRRINAAADHYEDLIAEGIVGLIKAADRFEPAQNVRFATYGHWWIGNSIRAASAKLRNIVDVPRGKTDQVLADPDAVIANPAALDAEDGGFDDALQCQRPNPEEHAIAGSEQVALRKDIALALSCLSDQERDIVLSRSFRAQPETLDVLADRHGMTKDRLRQIERRAMTRLKHALLSRGVTAKREH